MFKTKNLVHDVKEVPVPWVFEHYCKLKEKLNGKSVTINSLFNEKDRVPSMCIYLDKDKGEYRFKDFSSGKGGSCVELVKQFHGISFHESCRKITEDYNDYVLHNNGGYDIQEFKHHARYQVDSYQLRHWNSRDEYYWTQYNIGSRLLDKYNIRPFEHYTMKKMDMDTGKQMTLRIQGLYLYGYFKQDGTLYKIYQPKTQEKKFLKIANYIQGVEQLRGERWLLITSSLKDLLSLKSLKLEIDVVAPDSENTLINQNQMDAWIERYEKVLVMFDNDEAGIRAMQKYRETYNVSPILLDMSKDLSDSIRDHGAKEVRNRLVPMINRKISETMST
jgi:hypothetical protein